MKHFMAWKIHQHQIN